MSEQDKEQESQQIQWNEEELDQFFEYQKGDWMPYNSSQVYLSVKEYSLLFNSLELKQPLQINPLVYSNKFHFSERQHQHQNSQLNLKQQKQNQNLDNQKARIIQKIQAILARRTAKTINPLLPSKSTPSLIPQNYEDVGRSEMNRCKKRRRAVVTKQILDKLKKFFSLYNHSQDKPPSQRISFRDIAANLGVSVTEIAKLYQEYSQDALFSDRMKKLESATKQTMVKFYK